MIIPFRKPKLTDADIVHAMLNGSNDGMERVYAHMDRYFRQHAISMFAGDADTEDIFQETMIHLWREVQTGRIELRDGAVCRWCEGELRPMTSSLTTFLMAIAKRKHWEQLRHNQRTATRLAGDDDATTEDPRLQAAMDSISLTRYGDTVADEVQAARERIVSDCVLAMSPRCREIVTMFYYEQRSLDDILTEREENNSKMGLKTSKYKCMQRLRQMVADAFKRYDL